MRFLEWLLGDLIRKMVKVEIARIQSSPERYVACPQCGESYHVFNDCHIAHYAREATISCRKCHTHFNVKPGMFWESISVERR